METKIYVNSEENVCRVTLTCDEGVFIGTATCVSDEKFDAVKGIELAKKRALIQVKTADVKIFEDEYKALEEKRREYVEFMKTYERSRKKLRRAKSCLNNLYREVGTLVK